MNSRIKEIEKEIEYLDYLDKTGQPNATHREIKFRAWHKPTGIMDEVCEIDLMLQKL